MTTVYHVVINGCLLMSSDIYFEGTCVDFLFVCVCVCVLMEPFPVMMRMMSVCYSLTVINVFIGDLIG